MKLLGIIIDIDEFGNIILTDIPENLENIKCPCSVSIGYSKSTAGTCIIESIEFKRKKLIVKIANDRRQTDFHAEMGVWIDEEFLIFKSSDGFFISDLVGCKVFDSDNNYVGTLKDVYLLPANDVWIVDTEKGELPVPVVEHFVVHVDIKNRKIIINLLDGLMDLIQ